MCILFYSWTHGFSFSTPYLSLRVMCESYPAVCNAARRRRQGSRVLFLLLWLLRRRLQFTTVVVDDHAFMGVAQNGWFVRENPIRMDDLGAYFRKPPFITRDFWGVLSYLLSGMNNQIAKMKRKNPTRRMMKDLVPFFLQWLLQET